MPLHVRHAGGDLSSTHVALVVSILMLALLSVISVGVFMFFRRMRRVQKQTDSDAQLPLYEKRLSSSQRLTITAMPYGSRRESVVVYSEKQNMDHAILSVPEIRITFPDEVDDSGKRQSGRVVVVRVGEHSVGLEPLQEQLPPYQREADGRFDSLDLDRIGGLKEADSKYYA